ncbi:MAG TPA: ABC transporter permease [Candidatus Atribacteria bacterium]|nr:ABC transporter permease [Candidatus Atribacteria bacterium]HPT78570.1 ABC transporter permease [Candidatus Atribacteria bacterium]
MKNIFYQIFHSQKFVAGFSILMIILLILFIYPLIFPGDPLQMIGLSSFSKPGIYVSVYDAIDSEPSTMKLPDADVKRLMKKLSNEDRLAMKEWLVATGTPEDVIDILDTDGLLKLWKDSYDPSLKPEGMTLAKRNYYKRLNASLEKAFDYSRIIIATKDEETGELNEEKTVSSNDYININDVANVVYLPLGTDNFGADVAKKLVSAAKTSIMIGLIAGSIATFIGLTFGLLAGYVGGIVDDFIMFITNLFTVIPGFILLILISYGIDQDKRGAAVVALVIGVTSWTWTARSVRSQVLSLRNRDHVNLSKLSGHGLARIILTDILPYIASYVVMALILQISTAILAEAQLSMLGLGPKTTERPTLGLMMNWAMLYSAHTHGYWWAYFPVLLFIALISFSLNLMNTGLDQVFNPTLRD